MAQENGRSNPASGPATPSEDAPHTGTFPLQWARDAVAGILPEHIEYMELLADTPESLVITDPYCVALFLDALAVATYVEPRVRTLVSNRFTVFFRPELSREPLNFTFDIKGVMWKLGQPFYEAIQRYQEVMWRDFLAFLQTSRADVQAVHLGEAEINAGPALGALLDALSAVGQDVFAYGFSRRELGFELRFTLSENRSTTFPLAIALPYQGTASDPSAVFPQLIWSLLPDQWNAYKHQQQAFDEQKANREKRELMKD